MAARNGSYLKNIGHRLDEIEAAGRTRRLRPVGRASGGRIVLDGRELVNFSSNDYLGLARHRALVERGAQWARKWGAGATASRLVCGTMDLHVGVEEKLASGKKTETALIFNSGFQANSSVLAALLDKDAAGPEPLVFSDRLNHASIHHGCKAAGVRQIRYRHRDMDHLESLLKQNADKPGPRFIITETVFSMDGDRADLDALLNLKNKYGAFLYVDEAHATGLFGTDGFGLAAGRGADLIMGTFSKALGGFGAYIACSAKLRDFMVNRCAGFIYSTALPPAVLGAMDAALDLLPGLGAARERLQKNSEAVRKAFLGAGLDTGPSSTQIVPLMLGAEVHALETAKALEDAGILALAIRPPTVKKGTSRIRFALSAAHSDADIAGLIEAVLDLTP